MKRILRYKWKSDHFSHAENQLISNQFKYCFTISWLFLLVLSACNKDEVTPPIDLAMDYFPLNSENQWTYKVEGIEENGLVSSSKTEKWKVNSDLFINMYEITSTEEVYLGYKAMYLHDNQEINDIIGTFISVKYLNLPIDSLVLIAIDNVSILRERWIKGGIQKLDSPYGILDCICTKTIYQFSDLEEEYFYFCKDIGIYLIEKNYMYVDEEGNFFVGFTWRRTLEEYQVD